MLCPSLGSKFGMPLVQTESYARQPELRELIIPLPPHHGRNTKREAITGGNLENLENLIHTSDQHSI